MLQNDFTTDLQNVAKSLITSVSD